MARVKKDKNEFSYLSRRYKPKKSDFIIEYRVEPSAGLSLSQAAEKIAAESSIGTWTKLSTLSKKTFDKLSAKIFFVSEKEKLVKIAYPLELFEPRSIPQLLSSIAGNIFSMKDIKNLRLENIEFPDSYINKFSGPKFGLEGVRETFGIYKGPIVGSIIKPKVGLTAKQQALLAYNIFRNGVDIVKDDENLTSLTFDKFTERVKEVLKLKKRAEKETGKKKIYVFNITAPVKTMLERAEFVKKQGGECIMVDIISCGWSALQYLRDQDFGLIIHGHRAGHSAFTRNKKHGLTMLVVAKLARLAGIDQLHTGTVVGKMEGGKEEVLEIDNFIRGKWGKIKPTMPIASGGLHPGLVPKLVKILGEDLIINFGGGIHGHPEGSEAGAKAARQAVEATLKRIPLSKYAQDHHELKVALEYWSK